MLTTSLRGLGSNGRDIVISAAITAHRSSMSLIHVMLSTGIEEHPGLTDGEASTVDPQISSHQHLSFTLIPFGAN